MKKALLFIFVFAAILSWQTTKAESLFLKNLYFGLQNDSEVIKLQEFLTDEGLYSGPVTGNFFSLTLRAVRAFQVREEITPAAGYFGPKTRVRANALLDTQIQASNQQAIIETGQSVVESTVPQTANSSISGIQSQLETLLKQVVLLQQQIKSQQNQTQNQLPVLDILEIKSVIISPDKASAKIEWQTSKATESKVFVSGGNLSPKMFLSESGFSSSHIANVSSLSPTTNYSYEITAVNESGFIRKAGTFTTLDAFIPTFALDKEEIKNDGIDFATIRIETKLTNGEILPNKVLKIIISGVETTLYSDEQGILIYKTPTNRSPSEMFACGNNPTINISVKDPDNDAIIFVKSIKVIDVKPPVNRVTCA